MTILPLDMHGLWRAVAHIALMLCCSAAIYVGFGVLVWIRELLS